MKLLQTIEDVASRIAPGRAPHFIEPHIVKALTIISNEGPVGRINLAKTLGLGEGSIRTLIKHLEKEGVTRISRKGIVLTTAGQRLAYSLKSRISQAAEIPRSSLTVSTFNMAILVKDAANKVKVGVEQRDAAIKVGAQGATTLVFGRGRLTMPSAKEDALGSVPNIRGKLMSKFKPEENDVVVIGSADDELTAEYGAIAAALETLRALRG